MSDSEKNLLAGIVDMIERLKEEDPETYAALRKEIDNLEGAASGIARNISEAGLEGKLQHTPEQMAIVLQLASLKLLCATLTLELGMDGDLSREKMRETIEDRFFKSVCVAVFNISSEVTALEESREAAKALIEVLNRALAGQPVGEA